MGQPFSIARTTEETMATPVITPAAPIASAPTPVSAPAPAAPPASTPTPVAPGTPVPETQSPTTPEQSPATPDNTGTESTGTGGEPAKPAGGQPKKEDFDPDDIQGFLKALHEWEAAGSPEGEKPADVPAEGAEANTPEAKTDAQEVPTAEAAVDLTPQRITEWTEKSPEFAQLLEANPELKGEVYAMARLNAKAQPVLDIVASPEEARFAVDTANKMVDMRTGFALAAEDPSRFQPALEQFIDEFRVKDAAGNYVIDPATGKPQLAEDYGMIRDHFYKDVVSERTAAAAKLMGELKARIDSAVYPNAEAKQRDIQAYEDAEYNLSALQHVEAMMSGSGEAARPSLPEDASPELKAWEASLKEREAKLNENKQATTKEQKQQARQQFEQKMTVAHNRGVGSFIDEQMKSLTAQGVYIPEFVLRQRWINPSTGKEEAGVSNFAATILQQFNAAVNGDLDGKRRLATIQMLPPGPDAEAQRAAFQKDMRAKHLPKVFDAHVKFIQDGIRNDKTAIGQARDKQNLAATTEPNSGTAPSVKLRSDDDLRKMAKEEVAKAPDAKYISAQETLTRELSALNKLRAQRAR